jgi:hypothetical protein
MRTLVFGIHILHHCYQVKSDRHDSLIALLLSSLSPLLLRTSRCFRAARFLTSSSTLLSPGIKHQSLSHVGLLHKSESDSL